MSMGGPSTFADSIQPWRVEAVQRFGFTERQARFLVHVLVHSGVFLERQYRLFSGFKHGHNTQRFLRTLIERKYATVITPGKLHTGRLYHVQFKPLYEAIGEPDNRNRRPVALGRMIERLMLLDVVLGDKNHTWLATEKDKLAYFRAVEIFGRKLDDGYYPRLVFGDGARKTIRYFPDKLPIGIELGSGRPRHVFVYLVRQTIPSDFRVWLLRHGNLLRGLHEWTVRIVFPKRFYKAKALYLWAFRDDLTKRLSLSTVEEFEWYLKCRHGRDLTYTKTPPYVAFDEAAKKFRGARFKALEQVWLNGDPTVVHGAASTVIADKLGRGLGRPEIMLLPHQYLQLTSLVGIA
jgi:hypothetical protein